MKSAPREITLTIDERLALNLTGRQGLNQSQAADVAGCTRSTLNRRLARAKLKLSRLRLMIAEAGGDASDVDRLAGLSRGEGSN